MQTFVGVSALTAACGFTERCSRENRSYDPCPDMSKRLPQTADKEKKNKTGRLDIEKGFCR